VVAIIRGYEKGKNLGAAPKGLKESSFFGDSGQGWKKKDRPVEKVSIHK